jgi:RNA polymerase sigma-70 factor (ECF subfamily)
VNDWNGIVRTHGPTVFGLAWRILGHAADAEDVVQDVFLQAHQLQRTQRVRCWPAFLRRLTACRALDRLRTRRTTLPLDGLALYSPEQEPDAVLLGRELAERLRDSLAQLPPREASVFCLRYFEELSYQQIAEALQIQVGAVSAALHKARGRLETLLLEPIKGD